MTGPDDVHVPAERPRGTRARRRAARLVRRVAMGVALVVVAAMAAAVAFVAWPLPPQLLDRRAASSLVVTDGAGEPLRELRGGQGRSIPLANDTVPPLVRAAFIAAEDARFGSHPGVDVRALARAVKDSLVAGRVVSGASTIPQQLARQLVPRERTLLGKAGEALWALRLSAHLTKDEVLVEYANRVPLGRGTVGVEAASAAYFARPAAALSPAQAALLAGLAHAPAREDPLRFPERARVRRDVVLARMVRTGALDEAVAARARLEPLDVTAEEREGRAPHFVDAVLASLPARGLGDAVRVQTTLDATLQSAVERIVAEELGGPLDDARVGQAAVVVLDNETGAILAYAGSRDWASDDREGKNDGARAPRQPGSALKPFVYGLALSRGFTAASVLPDVELRLATTSGSYVPHNYDKRVHGPVRLRAALQNSYNIPAVHVASLLSPAVVVHGLRAAGFDSLRERPEHYGVGVVLGNGDVTLLELARAYRGLARGGVLEPLTDVLAASDGHGRALSIAAPFAPRRFLPAEATQLLTDVLADEESRIPAFGEDNVLSLPFPVAAKTGTSRAYVDNWTAGFTHERTVAVWAGNFDGTPMRAVSGITGAGTIFRRTMLAAMADVAHPAPLVDVAALDEADICPLSGALASPACPGAFTERFVPDTAPTTHCAVHTGHGLALDARYAGWARAEGVALARGVAGIDERGPHLLSPRTGDEFVREPGLPSGQEVPVQIANAAGDALELRTDGGPPVPLSVVAATGTALWLDLAPGTRTVTLHRRGDPLPLDTARFVVR